MMYATFRDKAIAENKARKAVDALFSEFKEKTSRQLKNCQGVVFEGVAPNNWPTDEFQSHFDSSVQMLHYFTKALAQTERQS
ncbi:MAG: hypothetical protein ACJAS1_005839 [Oleiphilaceae bacterium]|jgi:hypothetical protein